MRIAVVSCLRNEEYFLPFFFRHYDPHVDIYVLYDNMSTDRTAEIARAHVNVEVRTMDTGGKQNDPLRANVYSQAYRQIDADWFIAVDTDELMWHPARGLRAAIEDFHARGITVPLIQGWNMFSRNMPQDDGHTAIISMVRHGCRIDEFHNPFTGLTPIPLRHTFIYDKQLVFHRSADMNYGPGQHSCSIRGPAVYSPGKELFLLHYKWLGVWRKRPNVLNRGNGTIAKCAEPPWSKWFEGAWSARQEVVVKRS